jgi:hypothetical protein
LVLGFQGLQSEALAKDQGLKSEALAKDFGFGLSVALAGIPPSQPSLKEEENDVFGLPLCGTGKEVKREEERNISAIL